MVYVLDNISRTSSSGNGFLKNVSTTIIIEKVIVTHINSSVYLACESRKLHQQFNIMTILDLILK